MLLMCFLLTVSHLNKSVTVFGITNPLWCADWIICEKTKS